MNRSSATSNKDNSDTPGKIRQNRSSPLSKQSRNRNAESIQDISPQIDSLRKRELDVLPKVTVELE